MSSWYSYIPVHASATSAHAAAHKAHMPQKKAFLQHMGLNAGGAEVHMSCKNIQPGHVKPAVCWQNSRKILVNWKLCCGEDSPGKRKPGGIFSVLADIQQLLLHCLASGWRNNPRHPISSYLFILCFNVNF